MRKQIPGIDGEVWLYKAALDSDDKDLVAGCKWFSNNIWVPAYDNCYGVISARYHDHNTIVTAYPGIKWLLIIAMHGASHEKYHHLYLFDDLNEATIFKLRWS
jgi:hypothetical protein